MYKKNKVNLKKYLHDVDINKFFSDNNFRTVYQFQDVGARPDFRIKANRIKYYNDTMEIIRFNIHNLYISGVANDEDLSSLNAQLSRFAHNMNPSKADIEQLIRFNINIKITAMSEKQREKIDIDRNKINIYLNSADFDFFTRTIPATASIIMRTAKNNPELFLEWMANDMLPTYYNISEWDNISARILEDVSIYKDENEMADVLDEMSRYDEIIHKKRPWVVKEG